jgi:predicted nucleic acid-binding protein
LRVPAYLDTSAFLKLVWQEPESDALRSALGPVAELVSSTLLSVEALRAAARSGEAAQTRTRAALPAVTMMPLDDETLDLAARLEPAELRALDALHLATALRLGEDVERFFCYDRRLADGARNAGLPVLAPS